MIFALCMRVYLDFRLFQLCTDYELDRTFLPLIMLFCVKLKASYILIRIEETDQEQLFYVYKLMLSENG